MHRIIKAVRGNIVAWLALFVALGGTSLAASHYIITSTKQIKPSVLKQLQGKRGRAGANGANGANGAPGAQGPAGPVNLSTLTVVKGPEGSVPAGEIGSSLAFCPPGMKSVSGGGNSGIAGIVDSEPGGREGWFVITVNNTKVTVPVQAIAVCAASGQAVAAKAPSHAAAIHQLNQRLAALRAELAASKK